MCASHMNGSFKMVTLAEKQADWAKSGLPLLHLSLAEIDVRQERKRQDDKWGEQNHNPAEWLAVLTEEVGEVAQEVLRNRFGEMGLDDYRDKLTQVAAVAIAAIECLDRNVPVVECDAGCQSFAMRGQRYCAVCQSRLYLANAEPEAEASDSSTG